MAANTHSPEQSGLRWKPRRERKEAAYKIYKISILKNVNGNQAENV